ncbi:FtsB family cell division protein [Paenibacillus xerothermodurans]|uniref:Septum formation initiator family protein n=1 Tax=Paenibacillus xerothermodurans TaxID=1977292 RepID=A0A2W1NI36_PAEXE|nr:septum formation initiator family protein [Paenibacillus xerothermodurans]PZE19215.1 septum formation initiator family protein [Paenibacillus xerothermodurans]
MSSAQAAGTRTKQNNKGSYRRRRLVMIILACFLCWAGATLWNQIGKIEERSEKVAALEQKKEQALQMNEAAKREIIRLNDPEYVEQKIRKELHYVKQGETLFYVPKEQN